MNKAVLYAQARALGKKLRSEEEELREKKTLELVDLLNKNPDTNIVYDWYQGTDPDLKVKVTEYIILSRIEILGFEIDTTPYDVITYPESSNFHGYLKYNVLSKNRVSNILTKAKDYTLRRP